LTFSLQKRLSEAWGQREGQMTCSLEREIATYTGKLPELQMHSGKFVLIKGDDVVGIFDSYRDALKAGYEQFRLEPLLVKQIAVVEKALQFSREHALCR
jgi:hypothetical protein